MKQYISVKMIEVEQMTRLEYNELRGWTVPPDEDPSDNGYKCIDPVTTHLNWIPLDVFEATNRPFGDHVDRMTVELQDLLERQDGLAGFVGGDVFLELEACDQYLLRRQVGVMNEYSFILTERLGRAAIDAEAE